MTGPRPPWLATMLLSGILQTDVRDALLGDLCEEYALRAASSPKAAAWWYWHQALRSGPILFAARAWRGRWMSTAAIAAAAYMVVGALNAAGMSIVARWLGGSLSTNYIPAAMIGLTAIASGAHLASRIRPLAGDVLGGLVVIVAVLFVLFPVDASPLWYQLTFLVLGPLSAHLGATAALRNRTTGSSRP